MRLTRGYDSSSAQSADFVGEHAALDAKVVGKAGFTVVPESIRPMWKATDDDLAAIPALVTSLLA